MAINCIVLTGRLTRDVELRYTQNGTAVTKFTIAVDRVVGKDKEKSADFIDVVVWDRLAETCAEHIGKGRLVGVQGRLQIRSYNDSQGTRRKATEVVANTVQFLDSKNKNDTGGYTPGDDEVSSHLKDDVKKEDVKFEIKFNEEDIPF